MFNLLEGDGLIENIYHLLWTKDSIFGIDPYVVVPHTILYKYSKPCYWYFTSKVDAKLKKKSSSGLNPQHIKEEFMKGYNPDIDIVAYFIYKKYTKSNSKKYTSTMNTINYDTNDKNEEKNEKNDGLIIEYLSKQKFIHCIENKMPYEDGLLQKFEAPKGDNNFIIRLIWSPKMCLFEKKVNAKKINDNRYDIYERVVTFDGEEFQTETQPMRGTNLPDRIEKIANSIVNHISSISLEMIKIARMILNFRITSDDSIKLLWCSSLRLDKGSSELYSNKNEGLRFKAVDVEKISLSVPDNINLFQYSVKGKAVKTLKTSKCPNCDNQYEREKLCSVNFKTLIEAHDSRKRDKEFFKSIQNNKYTSSGIEILPYIENKNDTSVKSNITNSKVKNLLIPKVITEVFPKLKYDQYCKMKADEVFLSKSAMICERCFMSTTRYCNIAGTNTENVIRTLKNKSLPKLNMKGSVLNNQLKYN